MSKTAETIATQLQQVTSQLIERIAALEKAQYENVGKAGASPDLAQRVNDLMETNYINKGRQGLSMPLLLMLASLAGGIIVYMVQVAMVGR